MFATNCYLVYSKQGREAVVIDPGAEAKKIIEQINRLDLQPKYILNTHGHIDHIGACGRLKAEYDVPIMLHKKDLKLYENPGFGLKFVLKKQPRPTHFLEEGDLISFGDTELKVIETPGHTAGGVCFYTAGKLFSGDSLFQGSIGRTDLAGGSLAVLLESIKTKLLCLPPDTTVYPGHGPLTTLASEASFNPFLVTR